MGTQTFDDVDVVGIISSSIGESLAWELLGVRRSTWGPVCGVMILIFDCMKASKDVGIAGVGGVWDWVCILFSGLPSTRGFSRISCSGSLLCSTSYLLGLALNLWAASSLIFIRTGQCLDQASWFLPHLTHFLSFGSFFSIL